MLTLILTLTHKFLAPYFLIFLKPKFMYTPSRIFPQNMTQLISTFWRLAIKEKPLDILFRSYKDFTSTSSGRGTIGSK